MDASNLNKALISSNYPIPHQEDIRVQLSGANCFNKFDFKSAFWQLELDMKSLALMVFHANNKLYNYTKLIMGVKPAQRKLNAALKLIFSHIPNIHLIQNNLIIATKSTEEYLEAIHEVMEVIKSKNLTLNPNKYTFSSKEIKFWGMLFSSEGVKPDPEKTKALEDLQPLKNKEELKLFICMQSSSNFMHISENRFAHFRILLNSTEHFKWTTTHENVFQKLLQEFSKETLY